jgi:hypothetical protein
MTALNDAAYVRYVPYCYVYETAWRTPNLSDREATVAVTDLVGLFATRLQLEQLAQWNELRL